MHAISGKANLDPACIWPYLSYLGIRYKRKFLIILLFIILAATLADQISVVFKNLVQRLRPCHEPSLEGLVHLVNGECGGKFSFVSSHATNSFDVALLSLLFIRKRWFTISYNPLGNSCRIQQNIPWSSLSGRCDLRLTSGSINRMERL